MEHFFDRVLQAEINMDGYIVQFERMLSEQDFGGSVFYSIKQGFPYWPHNRGNMDFSDFRKQIGIQSLVQKARLSNLRVTKEEFVYYLEYILNILQIPNYCRNPLDAYCDSTDIRQILYRVLDDINCKIISREGGVYIVNKNSQIEIAKTITGDKYDLDTDLYLFTHSSIKNNLIKKADILCRIYKYIEGIRQQAKSYGYDSIFGDISKLMDGLDIRHAPNKKEEEILRDMPKEDVVRWYDQLFEMCLSLIILVNYASKRKDIKEFKAML